MKIKQDNTRKRIKNKQFCFQKITHCLFFAGALIYLQNKHKVTNLRAISIAPIISRNNMKVIKILVP